MHASITFEKFMAFSAKNRKIDEIWFGSILDYHGNFEKCSNVVLSVAL